MQYPWNPTASDWRPPLLGSLPSWRGARRVGFDLETGGNETLRALGHACRRDGWIAGFSFAIEGGPAHYVPVRHLGGDNVEDPVLALRYLCDQLRAFDGELVGANLPFDLDYAGHLMASSEGSSRGMGASRYSDVQIADALLSTLHKSYSLAAIAERHGLTGKDEHLLKVAAIEHGNLDPKVEMWKLPARYVGPYAEQDARLPLEILARQRRLLDEAQLDQVWKLESRLLPICVMMQARGVRVDLGRFEKIRRWCAKEEATQLAIVEGATGVKIAVGETQQPELLDRALRALNVVCPRTKTGVPSVKDSFLEALDMPVTRALARARKVAKLRGTFVEGTVKHAICHGDEWRVHAHFKQMANDDGGTRFGRMSCVRPNLQNQPAKDTELGDMLRSAFVPDRGTEWITADYSAQEPRMLVHWAVRFGCDRAQWAAKQFRDDPRTDSHRMMASLIFQRPQAAVTDKQRKQAKTIFLGLCYGMGSGKLAESLGLPTQKVQGGHVIAGAEAMKLLNRFHQAVPYVRELDKLCQNQAKQTGFIRTLSGRRCLFPVDDDGKYDWTRTALNRLIQGSSADQTKQAIIDCWDAGLAIQLPIHDEINMSGTPEDGKRMEACMVDAVKLVIPTKCDYEHGPNWAAASEDKEEAVQESAGGGFWDAAAPSPVVKETEERPSGRKNSTTPQRRIVEEMF